MPLDWVYRGREYDDDGAAVTPLSGTYMSASIGISAGLSAAVNQVLLDSHNYGARVQGFTPAAGLWKSIPNAGRPDATEDQVVRGVDLWMNFRPSSWALGNIVRVGWRVMIAEQDMATGGAVLDSAYSMWAAPAGVPNDDIVTWANGRTNVAEGNFVAGFGDGQNMFTIRRRIRTRRRLSPEEALYLYVELPNASVNITDVYFRCRSLVGADD